MAQTAILNFTLSSYFDPILTFATQKTATGFSANQIAWSTDGTNYTDFGLPYNPAASFALQTVDLSTINDLDGASSALLEDHVFRSYCDSWK